MTLLLVMFATIGARADEGTLSGSGTATDPYLIGSDADWETFVSYINDKGGQYRYKNYKLTADIHVTSMAGKNNDDNAFKGVFDGNGHTMTLNLTTDGSSYCAPFRYVGGSTFKRLHIAGKITSNSYYVASLVGYQRYGTLNIYNCWSSVDIMCTKKSSYSCNAGFVGYSYDSNININNCRFDGSLQGADADGCSGFVGQRNSNSSSMKISNCLFAPTQLTVATDNSYTFAYKSDVNTNNYYTTPLGKEQGTAIGNMTDSELLNKLGKGWEKKGDKVVPVFDIKNLSTGSIECNTFWAYTGEDITVTPTVKDMDGNTVSAENYSVSFSPSPVKEVGQYTMTVASNTANGYSGTLTHQFEVAKNISGTGTKDDPYLITSTDDWNLFAKSVAGGIDYYKKYVKLTNDITISTMVGVCDESGDRPFRGIFEGDNHTLTANITSTATDDNKNNQGVAPFHLIKQATIQNLTVAGQITSASKYAAGLVGWVDGDYNSSYIKNCVVKATITTSADWAGGFVGNICYSDRNNLYFTNSVFAGKIINTSSDDRRSAGGFCGYGYGYSYFENCLENGSYTNITYMNPRNAYGFFSNERVNSLYYVNKIAVNNKYIAKEYGCYQVANTAPADELYLKREIKGYQFYQSVWITGLNDSYPYNNGEEVSLAYELKTNSGKLTKDTDYTVTLSSNAPAAAGDYTISFTAKEGNSGGYAGTTTRTFSVMEGEDLDGYVFKTEGEGESKVYLINDERDLERLAAYVNSGHDALGKTFKQNTDITLTAAHTSIGGYYKQSADITLTNEHTAIGNSSNTSFRGVYDGDNKVIKGLLINQAEGTYQGLFGRAYKATIKNVIIENCDITAKDYVGGICGHASETTISNCKVSGAIKTADGVDGMYHGGIAGYINDKSISSCVNTASVKGNNSKSQYYGGIVGFSSYTRVTDCFNAGIVQGTSFVGSIVGKNNSTSTLRDNYHTTTTTGGVGANGVATGTDQTGATTVAKITATEGVTLTLPTTPTYVWNNENLYESGVVVTLDCTVPEGKYWDHYTVNNGKISNAGVKGGEHTLTDFTADVVISATFASELTDIATAGAIIADIEDLTYNGKEQHPSPVVTLNSNVLEAGSNYQVTYSEGCTNVGTYTITVEGIGRYSGRLTKTFKIVPYDISGCDIKVENKPYTGDVINVTPTVKYGSITLAQGEDKDYTFVTNPTTVQEAGDYTLTVTGKGNYTGTKEVSFTVYYSTPTELSCTNVTATTAIVTWKDGIATKWTVAYSTDKTFESAAHIDVENAKTASLENLSADQVYYVRVKAVYGSQESDWSNVCSFEPTTKLLVGSGNNTSSSLPFSNWYYYGLTQQIYTAKELGNKAGSIMALDFFRTDNNSCNNTIEIYLVKTDKTMFTTSSDWISVTEEDKVYDGKMQFESNQWTTIELTKPFDYDGVSNLALIVYDKKVSGDSYGGGRNFRTFKGNDNQTLYFRSDKDDPTIRPTVTGTPSNSKNQLRIRMADKITMNGLGIMSYTSDNVLDFSNVGELTAHYASSFAATANNAGVLTMTQVETTPAGEGLMLKGTANETFYVPALFNLTPEALTGNNLKGLTKITEVETTEGDKTNFILSQQKGVIAWYPLAAKYALKAHSAYLQLLTNDVFTNEGTRAISMEFEDGVTTGFIQIATDDVEDGDWYGIDGIKFNQKPTQRGVYINNGRKVIVK